MVLPARLGRLASACATTLLAACGAARLERVSPAELQARLQALVAEGRAPGIAVAAARGEGPAVVRVAGLADRTSARPLEAGTPFPWFSATKLFTATAVMQLAAEGKLELDRPVRELLPAFAPRSRWATPVTTRHLLSHTSGLPNPIPIAWIHLAEEPAPDLEALTARLLEQHGDLSSEPGTRYAYSNLGYLVLGRLLEQASGRPYAEELAARVLAPLGATGAAFAVPPDVARGHQRRWTPLGLAAWWMLPERFFGPARAGLWELRPFAVDGAPYGGLFGPVEELLLLGRAMLRQGAGAQGALLPPVAAAAMLAPARTAGGEPLSVGLGWHLGEVEGEPCAWHVGGGGGFKTELRIYPRLGYAIAVAGSETSFDTGELTRLVVEAN